MEDEHDVVLAGGQGKLQGKIFRIGHLGLVEEEDIRDTLQSLEAGAAEAGVQAGRCPLNPRLARTTASRGAALCLNDVPFDKRRLAVRSVMPRCITLRPSTWIPRRPAHPRLT